MKCSKCGKTVPDNSIYCMFCGFRISPVKHATKKRANGLGTIYKYKGKWRVIVTTGYYTDDYGTLHRTTKSKAGFDTKRDAEKYLAELSTGTNQEKRGKVSYYWKQYAATELNTISENRQRQYKKVYNQMSGLHNRDIATLTLDELQAAVDSVGNTYYSCKYAQTVLSKIYTVAMRENAVSHNLSLHIVLPKKEEKESKAFNENEIKQIWTAYNSGDSWQGYILLMIYTGMMPGEVMGLSKNMIYLKSQMIVGAGLKTSTRKSAPIMLADAIVPIVSKLIEQSDDLLIYPYSKKKFYDDYYKAIERAGVRKLPPYSCRHTTGTALAVATNNPELVKAFMRHANIGTTQRYIHIGKDELLETANKIEK